MKNRKQVLIDKKFQLTKSFSVIGFFSVIVIVIILLIGIFLLSNNQNLNTETVYLEKSILDLKQIMELQQSVFISLSSRPTIDNSKVDVQEANQLNADYNSSIQKLTNTIKKNESIVVSNQNIVEMNNWLIGVVSIVFLLGILVLYLLMIRFTHRISGPIFVMTRHMNDVLEGKKPQMYDLRTKDEFKDFYKLFRQMVAKQMETKKE